MNENGSLVAEQVEQLVKQVKMLLPIPQYSIFKSPKELEFVGQGLFKIVYKYGDKAVKYFKYTRMNEQEVEKLKTLSGLDTFEQFYLQGTRWIVTEFIEGKKLKEKDIILSKKAVEKVREDMFACLALGWSPNDLHFGNFLVEPSGQIRCIDVDLFKDIRHYDENKQARFREWAVERIEALYRKMFRLVQEV